jgi:hypothetical protein
MLFSKPNILAHLTRDPGPRWLDGPCGPVPNVERLCADPFVCFVEGGDDDDGDKGKDKTFTQDEVERIVKKRIAKAEKENAALTKRADAAEAESKKNADAIEKLQARLDDSGKGTNTEKELAQLTRKHAKLEADMAKAKAELGEAQAAAEKATAGLSNTKLRTMVREALRGAKAHGKGMEQAVTLMMHDAEIKLDDDGKFTATIDGVPYDKPEDASKKWLETNPHFAEGVGGGSGSPRAGGTTKMLSPDQLDSMHPTSLLGIGLQQKPSGSPD